MAAPAYATDLTDIVVPPMTTGEWGAFGGGASGLNAETDYYLLDSDCLSKNAWASDYKGAVWDNGTDIAIPTGDALWVWLTHLTPNSLAAEASGGLRVVMADANTESTFDEWYVGGSDTIIYDDRWLCAVVDPDETPDNNNGATADYSWFGAGANLPTGGPTKGAPFAIAAIRRGRELQCTAGDVGNGYATFDGAATYNDATTRRFGQFQLSGGTYKMQGLFVLGTATTAVDFRDENRSIFIARTPKVGAGFNGFEVRNASSRVDWTNVTIQALGTQSPGYFEMVANADVNLLNCSFVDMGAFDFLSNGSALGCVWRGCGQITAPGADVSGSSVSGYEGTADTSSLIWDVATDPNTYLDGMTFTKGTAATHAIEFGTNIPSTITLTDMTFDGYGADASTSAALHFKDTAGTITVNLSGTTTPTYKSDGATIVFQNTVTLTFTPLISGSALTVSQASDQTVLHDDAPTGTSSAYDYNAATLGGVSVNITIMEIGSEPYEVKGFSLPNDSAEFNVSQITDSIYSNPT